MSEPRWRLLEIAGWGWVAARVLDELPGAVRIDRLTAVRWSLMPFGLIFARHPGYQRGLPEHQTFALQPSLVLHAVDVENMADGCDLAWSRVAVADGMTLVDDGRDAMSRAALASEVAALKKEAVGG